MAGCLDEAQYAAKERPADMGDRALAESRALFTASGLNPQVRPSLALFTRSVAKGVSNEW